MREAYEFRHCRQSGQWAERGLWINFQSTYGTKTPGVAWCFPVNLRGLESRSDSLWSNRLPMENSVPRPIPPTTMPMRLSMVQIGCVVLAIGMLYAGIQGLGGRPDSDGKQTSKPVAIACLILAAAILVFAFVILPAL